MALIASDNLDEVVLQVSDLLAHTPDDPDAYLLRARIFLAQEDINAARQWLGQAKRLDGSSATAAVQNLEQALNHKEVEKFGTRVFGRELKELMVSQASIYPKARIPVLIKALD